MKTQPKQHIGSLPFASVHPMEQTLKNFIDWRERHWEGITIATEVIHNKTFAYGTQMFFLNFAKRLKNRHAS